MIRGGGGNFGVATRFQFRLHPVTAVFGGTLVLPATPAVIEGFVAAAEAAPDELSTIANIMSAPPLPFLPEEQHGQLVLMAMMAYAGRHGDGEPAAAPFRSLAEPIADLLQPVPYPDLFPEHPQDFHPVTASRTMLMDRVDQRAAETILEHLEARTSPMAVTQLRVLGGAVAGVPAEATAFAHRDRGLMANAAAIYDDEDRATHEEWAETFASALSPDRGAYVNFLGEADESRVREAYPGATWGRLREIKARYDPDNVFRLNQNIPPAEGGAEPDR